MSVKEEPFQRTVFIYRNYFYDFYTKLDSKVKRKVDFVLGLVRDLKYIPEKFFKHIEGSEGMYELRIQAGRNSYRVFCFFDKRNVVVVINGFQKKTAKTPKTEINRAERIKKEYEHEKAERKY
ncbi:MAG TPA: type II toxin-antitoxin system RelE/ParE family toxin [Bacteroidota bacterium]